MTPDFEQIERDHANAMVESVQAKVVRGEKPSRAELRAWRTWEREQLEDYGQRYVRAVPRAHYLEWTQKASRVVYAQGEDFGFPFRGKTLAIPDIIRRLHEMLKDRRDALLQQEGKDAVESESMERIRSAKADMIEDQRDLQRGQLIRRSDVREINTKWSSLLRAAGERLGRRFGRDAQEILDEALDDCDTLIDEFYGTEEPVT